MAPKVQMSFAFLFSLFDLKQYCESDVSIYFTHFHIKGPKGFTECPSAGLHNLPIFLLICLIYLISTLLSSLISTFCRDNSTLYLQGCLHPTLLCERMHRYCFYKPDIPTLLCKQNVDITLFQPYDLLKILII